MNEKIKRIWDKICASAGAAGEFASKTVDSAGKKATNVYNVSKINLKIFDLKTDIDILYKEIGRLIYAAHTNEETSTEELDARLLAIDEKNGQIEELRAQLESAKEAKKCRECGKINERDSAFCSGCGAQLND